MSRPVVWLPVNRRTRRPESVRSNETAGERFTGEPLTWGHSHILFCVMTGAAAIGLGSLATHSNGLVEEPVLPLLRGKDRLRAGFQCSLLMSFQATITANLSSAPTRTLIQKRVRTSSSSRWQPFIQVTSSLRDHGECPGIARVYPTRLRVIHTGGKTDSHR